MFIVEDFGLGVSTLMSDTAHPRRQSHCYCMRGGKVDIFAENIFAEVLCVGSFPFTAGS